MATPEVVGTGGEVSDVKGYAPVMVEPANDAASAERIQQVTQTGPRPDGANKPRRLAHAQLSVVERLRLVGDFVG